MRIFGTKRRAGLVGLGVVAGLAMSAVVSAAVTFGPSRPTFTMANPASYVTFNSITDNPTWGDERQLLKSRDINSPTTAYAAQTNVTDNEEVVLAVYFHNNAATNLGLTATGTKVKFDLPSTSAATVSPTAYISADNANPGQVWATSDLSSSQPFTISYEPGTAKLYSNYISGFTQLSDNVVNGGTLIGTNGPDGKVPGCAQFSGYVTIRVRVHVTPPQSSFACSMLDVAKIDRTRYDFTAHSTVTNTTVSSYTFIVKDANSKVIDTNTVTTSASSAVYHFNQSTPGTYTVAASVTTEKGTASSTECVKQITVAAPPVTPPATTPPATSLPNTGAGDVLGIFTGASAFGTVGHYVISRRKRGL